MATNKQIFTGFLLLIFILAPCTGRGQERKQLSIATGPSTAAYYALGAGMSQMAKKYIPEYSLSVGATGGSAENVRLVGTGQADLGIVMPDAAYYGYKGTGTSASAYPNLRGVMAGHLSIHHLVTLSDSIQSVADLKGKKVALSNPGSAAANASKAILAAYGLNEGDYKAEYLSYPEQVQAMKDGVLDAGFIMSGIPAGAVTELAVSRKVKLIPLDPAKLESVVGDNPYWTKATIPANTYKGQEQSVLALAAPAILIANSNTPDEFVYRLMKMIIEHNQELTAIHVVGKYWDMDGVIDSIAIPLHPGAIKYLSEHNVSIPGNLKP